MVSHSDDIIRRGKQNPTEREIPEHNQDAVSFHLVRFKPGIGPGGRRIFIVCDGPGDEQASPAEKTLAESLTRAVPVGEEGPCERKNALSIIPHPTLIITLLILCGAFPGKQIAHSGDHIPRVVVPTFADKYRNVWVLAGRLERILELVDSAPYKSWTYRNWGVKALVAMGRNTEALRYAEDSRGLNDSPFLLAEACEGILLSMGRSEEAYRRYSFQAKRKSTYLATFRAVASKYPERAPRDILRDLVASTPGEEGKWFAAARSAGLLEEAAELARSSPCDPKTLIRAARDHAATEPWFALEAGLAALRWIAEGYGYEITGLDVREAYGRTMRAAEIVGRRDSVLSRVFQLAEKHTEGGRLLASVLRPM